MLGAGASRGRDKQPHASRRGDRHGSLNLDSEACTWSITRVSGQIVFAVKRSYQKKSTAVVDVKKCVVQKVARIRAAILVHRFCILSPSWTKTMNDSVLRQLNSSTFI